MIFIIEISVDCSLENKSNSTVPLGDVPESVDLQFPSKIPSLDLLADTKFSRLDFVIFPALRRQRQNSSIPVQNRVIGTDKMLCILLSLVFLYPAENSGDSKIR